MDYIEESLEKFNNLPKEVQDFVNSEKVIKTLENIESTYGVDLTLSLVLIFIGELDLEDLGVDLEERFDLDEERISKILVKLENNIFKEVADSFSESNSDDQPELDYLLDISHEDKIKIISEIFLKNILDQFGLSETHLLRLNAVIFELIGKDEKFLNKIVRYFLDNEEKISSNKLVIKGKEEEPTISNWIKDFVDLNDSNMFSSVVLAKYLITSENVKKLNQEERQTLRQILKIYKNLVFFPESMGSAKYLDWEIFPINRDLLNIYKKDFNKILKTEDNFVKIVNEVKDDGEVKLEKEIKPEVKSETKKEIKKEIKEEVKSEFKKVEPEIKKEVKSEIKIKPQIKEIEKSSEYLEKVKLQEMLAKYPKNSLERKAIESEIKKIDKKQTK